MKLIAIDMDGTLLSSDGTISQANREAIYRVQEQGSIVAICSGRSVLDIQEILQQSQINASIIGGNGAAIYHQKLLTQLALPIELLNELIGIVESENMYYEIYTNDGIYVKDAGRELLLREVEERLAKDSNLQREVFEHKIGVQYNQHHLRMVSDISTIDFSGIGAYKVYAYTFLDEKRERLKKRITGRKDISITTGGTEPVEIGHPEASKGYGLTYLANFFNIPLENTVSIGDNLNDISMFAISGMSIAMGNAKEEVKSHAKLVTKTRDQDGVAFALNNYVLNSGVNS